MNGIYILLVFLLVNTSYQQNIFPEHKRRHCNALQTAEVMEQALPEIRRYLQTASESSRRQIEEIKTSMKVVQAKLETTRKLLRVHIQGCEGDWAYHGGYCYLFLQTNVNYGEAKARCTHEDAYIADVKNEREHQFIKAELNKIDIYNSRDYYLGGYYKRTEDEWIWERTGETIEFTRWGTGEPNDHNKGEDCLFIVNKQNRLWNDHSCLKRCGVIYIVKE